VVGHSRQPGEQGDDREITIHYKKRIIPVALRGYASASNNDVVVGWRGGGGRKDFIVGRRRVVVLIVEGRVEQQIPAAAASASPQRPGRGGRDGQGKVQVLCQLAQLIAGQEERLVVRRPSPLVSPRAIHEQP
jgi:hypothetical protein